MEGLKGKSALITGAAGGLGSEICRRFVKEGVRVAIADISQERADALRAELEKKGGEAVVILVDLHDEESIKSMIHTAAKAFGGIDILVNCAMETRQEISSKDIDVLSMDVGAWQAMFEVNLMATGLTCKHVAPVMFERGGGNIVNFASVAGMIGEDVEFGYGCLKAGVIQLTRSVATVCGKRGIRCNSISPGLIRHPRIEGALPPAILDLVMDNQLLAYPSKPEHISGVVAFLASDESAFITGENIVVDGGTSAHNQTWAMQRKLFSEGFEIAKDD